MEVNIKEIMTDIVKQCWKDTAFKKRFINAPIETIQDFKGGAFDLGAYKRLVVKDTKLNLGDRPMFENGENGELVMYMLRKPSFENMELTDKDLELVAGGCWEDGEIGSALDNLKNLGGNN